MSYTTGQALRPFSSNSSSMLRVLLINSCVSRNTKALVAQVKENRVNLMPKVAASILESMDRVAREAAETLAKLLNNNNNLHDQGLFHKLEVNISNQFCAKSFGVSLALLTLLKVFENVTFLL